MNPPHTEQPLYLIRQHLKTILGPLNAAEIARGLELGELTPQDEVCGHGKRWILLSQAPLVESLYPELFTTLPLKGQFYQDHIPTKANKPLGEPTDHRSEGLPPSAPKDPSLPYQTVLLPTYDPPPSLAKPEVAHPRPLYRAWIAAGGLLLFALGLRLWQQTDPYESIRILTALTRPQDQAQFVATFEHALDSTPLSPAQRGPWIPLLRLYSFYKGGALYHDPITSGEWLGQNAPPYAPEEASCSVAAWKKHFAESLPEWADLVYLRCLPQGLWAKALAWDPYWVKDQTHWFIPGESWGYCLGLGLRALGELKQEPTFVRLVEHMYPDTAEDLITSLWSRLNWQNYVIFGTPFDSRQVAAPGHNTLAMWNCLEMAKNQDGLNTCGVQQGKGSDEGLRYQELRYLINLVRLHPQSAKKLTQTPWMRAWKARHVHTRTDPYTQLPCPDLKILGPTTSPSHIK